MSIIKKILKIMLYEQYRIEVFCEYIGNESDKPNIVKRFLRRVLRKKYGIVILYTTRIGEGLNLPHPQNRIFGGGVVIKENVTIYHNVTLGTKRVQDIDLNNIYNAYPVIESGCCIYSGACIIGNIKIEKNTVIAANAVVIDDTEKSSVYGGIPAKRLDKIG